MKVKILVEFEVDDTDDENVAKSAASMAAYHYLAFCDAIGVNRGQDECEVHVDGHGEFTVRIGEDHE
jgi:hypothetical protein